jgi:ubiquinone/menaquinone biosynthesis C-methylase UbiE
MELENPDKIKEKLKNNTRISRERSFHDCAYETQIRSNLSFMYPEHTSIQQQYEHTISFDCAGKKVLEYGCGLGSHTYSLAEKKGIVYGIDISNIAIEQARDNATERNVSIDFRVMNAEELEFPAETFDIVCGSSILHHLDLAKAVTEINRVLRKGGKAVFIEPLGHNPFISLFRFMTPKMRSHDEHPLTVKDLQLLSTQFMEVKIQYYYLLSIITVPFQNKRYLKVIVDCLEGIDNMLFTWFPFARKYSWQVLITLLKK